jgi:hypothetical protein
MSLAPRIITTWYHEPSDEKYLSQFMSTYFTPALGLGSSCTETFLPFFLFFVLTKVINNKVVYNPYRIAGQPTQYVSHWPV